MTYSQQFQDRTNSYNNDLQRQWDSATSNYQVEVANAGQTASHSLHPIHLSSPFGYFLKACRPLNLFDVGVF